MYHCKLIAIMMNIMITHNMYNSGFHEHIPFPLVSSGLPTIPAPLKEDRSSVRSVRSVSRQGTVLGLQGGSFPMATGNKH